MKKAILIVLLIALSINVDAQLKLSSDFQVIKNSRGVNFNKYKVDITLNEPKKVGGDVGNVILYLYKMQSSLNFLIQYVKEIKDDDGITYWYYIMNSERGEMFNVVKIQKFKKTLFDNKYTHSVILSKYNENMVLLYEHTYFAK